MDLLTIRCLKPIQNRQGRPVFVDHTFPLNLENERLRLRRARCISPIVVTAFLGLHIRGKEF
jgi:hypothetical protein